MNSKDFLKEGFVEDAHMMHQDHEVQMAREECYHAAENAIVLHKLLRNISEQQGLEGWVSAKITLAGDYLKTVREYIEYELMSAASEQPMLPIAEGSGSKEKQKTPYRDINSPEYRAAADKQKQRMAKNKAAEPGKKMLAKQGVAEGSLSEFAVSGDGDGGDDSLFNYAKLWYNGDLKIQQQVEKALQKSGLDIGENEDENGGAYISDKSGDYYESWTAEDLKQGVAEASNDYFKRRKDEEDRIAGTKPPARRTPQQTDYARRRAQEKKTEQGVAEGSACNHTMEGKRCPTHGLKECPGYKSSIEETTAGSVAGVVNPTPKNKTKVGTLFGGTYKQKKTKA